MPQKINAVWVRSIACAVATLIVSLITTGGQLHAGSVAGSTQVPSSRTILFLTHQDCGQDKDCARETLVSSPLNVWEVSLDGSAAHLLTQEGGVNAGPVAWSPDGAKVAFLSNRTVDRKLAKPAFINQSGFNTWVMNVDGSDAIPLVDESGRAFADPAWSADGNKLVAALILLDPKQRTPVNENLWIVNPDGSGAIQLTQFVKSFVALLDFAWSPDGHKIAYLSNRALDGEDGPNSPDKTRLIENIWVVNADGSGGAPLTKFTNNGIHIQDLAWSPDGRKLAYSSNRALDGSDARDPNQAMNIWMINADGSSSTALTRFHHSWSESPAWSPNGAHLAFSSDAALEGVDFANPKSGAYINSNHVSNIWVMRPDGSAAVPLTTLTAVGARSRLPAWSPDGTMISFLSARALGGRDAANAHSTTNLWVIRTDGSGARALTQFTYPSFVTQSKWRR